MGGFYRQVAIFLSHVIGSDASLEEPGGIRRKGERSLKMTGGHAFSYGNGLFFSE